jgi:hypothetical protein
VECDGCRVGSTAGNVDYVLSVERLYQAGVIAHAVPTQSQHYTFETNLFCRILVLISNYMNQGVIRFNIKNISYTNNAAPNKRGYHKVVSQNKFEKKYIHITLIYQEYRRVIFGAPNNVLVVNYIEFFKKLSAFVKSPSGCYFNFFS